MSDSSFFAEHSELALGALLAAERRRAGLSQYAMAQKLGLSGWHVEAIESGDTRGSGFSRELLRRTLALYARKLGLSPPQPNLCGLKPKPKPDLSFLSSQTPALLRRPAIAGGADGALVGGDT